MGATFTVSIITFIGILLLAPGLAAKAKQYPDAFSAVGNGFAGGALIAAAFYLLFYESTHLITTDTEAASTALWGSMALIGFITAPILELLVWMMVPRSPQLPTTATTEGTKVGQLVEVTDLSVRTRVLSGVLLGDFIHNLVDGLFIGTAFLACGNKMGWSVTAATVYHELAQELSDFVVLTDPKQGGLSPVKALLCNWVSGLSVVLGAIIILTVDVDNRAMGMLLSYGGGVYLQIGASECMPKFYSSASKSKLLHFAGIAAFCIGCLAIGLVLFDHDHCVAAPSGATGAAATGGAHAGHNHGR